MKKLFVIILAVVLASVFTACDNSIVNENSSLSDTVSSDQQNPSEETENIGYGTKIPYKTVIDGYIEQRNIWESRVVPFEGFQCIEDYLYLPAPCMITCSSDFAVYVYKKDGNYLVLDVDAIKESGQVINQNMSIQRRKGELSFSEDVIVRFVVKGLLDEISVFVPTERESEIKIGTANEFLK